MAFRLFVDPMPLNGNGWGRPILNSLPLLQEDTAAASSEADVNSIP